MKFQCGTLEAALCFLLASGVSALVLDTETDITVFTMGKCRDIVDKVNATGQFTQESTISICNKRLASKESCRLVGEMLAMAELRGAVNTSSFCAAMSSAHACSSNMEDFLSSEAVSDLAFGHCMRQKPAKSQDYCRQFQHVMSTAVKASESMDTLRECYMMELAHQKTQTEKSKPLSSASAAKTPKLVAAAAAAAQPLLPAVLPVAVAAATEQPVAAASAKATVAGPGSLGAQPEATASAQAVVAGWLARNAARGGAQASAQAIPGVDFLATTAYTNLGAQPVAAASGQAVVAGPGSELGAQPVATAATPVVMAAAQPAAAQQVTPMELAQAIPPVETALQTAVTAAQSQQSAVQPQQVAQATEQQAVPLKVEEPVTTATQQVAQPAAQAEPIAQTQQLSVAVQSPAPLQGQPEALTELQQSQAPQVVQTPALQQTEEATQANTPQVALQQLASPAASSGALSPSTAAAATVQQPEQGTRSVQAAVAMAQPQQLQAFAQPASAFIAIKPHSAVIVAAATSVPAATSGAAAATPAAQKPAAAAAKDVSKSSFLAGNSSSVPAKANVNSTSGKEYTGFLSRFVGF